MSSFSFKKTMSSVTSKISNPEIKATILLGVVAFHALLLMCLSWRQRRSAQPVLRFLLWGVSAAYFPLMNYALSMLTTYTPSVEHLPSTLLVLVLVVLVQFIRAKADMAAMAVAAIASPAASDDDVNRLKIRPSTQHLVNTFWVAGLVIYNVYKFVKAMLLHPPDTAIILCPALLVGVMTLLILPVWVLGACKTVIRYVAFQRATYSVALGRNVHLIDGYMLQLRESGCFEGDGEAAAAPSVPRLIVTGERDQDVVESPAGYRVKLSALQDQGSRLVTLDRVWSSSDRDDGRVLVQQEHRDLCLSFSLFKCLRRRFAGYGLAAEAGSGWAFRFVRDGLLGPEDDHGRIFRVIATELSFASDFFHSSLPVASLGTMVAALHFLFSIVIIPSLLLLALVVLMALVLLFPDGETPLTFELSLRYCNKEDKDSYPLALALLALVLTLLNAVMEIWEMVDSVRSNWTKISIVGHLVRSRYHCTRRLYACLLKWKARKLWKDKIRQVQLLLLPKPAGLRCMQQPWARRVTLRARRLLGLRDSINVPAEVKEAILKSFGRSGGQLSDGMSAIRHHGFANNITWACRDGGGGVLTTTTDAILVWHIATTLFDLKCSSTGSPAVSSSSKVVACSLSRYCAYLVAEAPDLLPDNPAWTTRRYQAVKQGIEEAWSSMRSADVSGDSSCMYQQMVDTFYGKNFHEVQDKGLRLGKQLVEAADEQRQTSQGGGGGESGGPDAVWELLSDFWSEMLLYLAPSDNIKSHIEALQRGGELITLLWALLLHAGITSRPVQSDFNASALLSTGYPATDTVDVHI